MKAEKGGVEKRDGGSELITEQLGQYPRMESVRGQGQLIWMVSKGRVGGGVKEL